MEPITIVLSGISVLGLVVSVLWLTLRGVEKRFGRKLADAEATCREELATERALREKDHHSLRELEGDVRKLLLGEVSKSTFALSMVGDRLGRMIDRLDEVADMVGAPPRLKDPDRATTVQIAALTGVQP